ncbi:MAG: hypothetical protein P4L92_23500 [Rudaea sp.]|nr:hypothetical protein [Rudaea sp.]
MSNERAWVRALGNYSATPRTVQDIGQFAEPLPTARTDAASIRTSSNQAEPG